MPNRREFVTGALSLSGALGIGAVPSAADDVPSLKQLGAVKGLMIGSAMSDNPSRALMAIFKKHCHFLTPENALKPARIGAGGQDSYDFSGTDTVFQFCREYGLKMHGHTLFWHQSHPDWLNDKNFGELYQKYKIYIYNVMSRYRSVTPTWDVVNEVFSEQDLLYRDQFNLTRHGDDFIAALFAIANSVDPKATLLVNDFNFECQEDNCRQKRKNLLKFLKRMANRRVPIGGVGIQSHLSSDTSVSGRATANFIRKIGELGFDVYLTEMDVNDIFLPTNVQQRDLQVAGYYADYLGHVLAEPNVKGLTFWGISDSDQWLVRGDNPEVKTDAPPRPALFDENNQTKPAFWAVVDALTNAPARAPAEPEKRNRKRRTRNRLGRARRRSP